METEAGSAPASSRRVNPLLLALLGIAIVVFLLMKLGGSAAPPPAPRAARAAQGRAVADAKVDPAQLDVQLEALDAEKPGPGETDRNPFRFQPKAPPPAPAPPPSSKPAPPPEDVPVLPPPPPAPPPITVKFIGTVDLPDGITMAIFTDCTVGRRNIVVREGGTILGQYRLVKIGLQSVVVEHLDGRGRTTLPKGGQECVK